VKVLGIDPGSIVTGYGVVDVGQGRPVVLESGVISPESGKSFPERLLEIYERLVELIRTSAPDEMAVESLFYGTNARTLTVIAQVRGVVLLAAAASGSL